MTEREGQALRQPDGEPDFGRLEEVALPGGTLTLRCWSARPEESAAEAGALLLHGFCADSTTWMLLGPALARAGIGSIAFDLPSHGASRLEAEGLEALVEAVAAGLHRLGARPALLVGHSLGGLVAAEIAVRRPEGLRRLLLLSPAGMGREIDRALLRALPLAQSAEVFAGLLGRLGGSLPPPPVELCRTVVAQNLAHAGLGALAEDLVGPEGQRHDLARRLEGVAAEVTLAMGLDDRMIPWQQVANLPAGVAVHLLKGVGHVPHWELPDLIERLAIRSRGEPTA